MPGNKIYATVRIGILFFFVVLHTPVFADELLLLENKYIKVFVNNTRDETGRFAIDIKEGDPTRASDDNKPLIYGHPLPWTSFTTIRIDGQNYLFGGKTNKRAGKGWPVCGISTGPVLKDNTIVMSCWFNYVEVSQVLSIVKGPSTALPDTLKIKYVISNGGDQPVKIGARIVLDALLGENDGAPFRFFEKAVTTDTMIKKEELPEFWQAFDSLAEPQVIAQGTLKGGEVTVPDQVIFTNWGKLADEIWSVPLDETADFTRAGEFELDSAVALYYNEALLQPGESRTIIAYYGLGALEIHPGELFLGVSSPAEVVAGGKNNPGTFSVMAYIMNPASVPTQDVSVSLECSPGLKIVSKNKTERFKDIQPAEIKQVVWRVRADGDSYGETSFSIKARARGISDNTVSRTINIVAPPRLNLSCVIPELGPDFKRDFFKAEVEVSNTGSADANEVTVSLLPTEGLLLAEKEINQKFLGSLGKGEKVKLNWYLACASPDINEVKFLVTAASVTAETVILQKQLEIPSTRPEIYFDFKDKVYRAGEIVSIDLKGRNLPRIKEVTAEITYNPEVLLVMNISRGLFFVENYKLLNWENENTAGLIGKLSFSGGRTTPAGPETSFATITVRILKGVNSRLSVNRLQLTDFSGEKHDIPVKDAVINAG